MAKPTRPQIRLRGNDRVILTGKTGSGKTYAARKLTAGLKRLIVLDTKGSLDSWSLEPWSATTQAALEKGDPVRARVLAPEPSTLAKESDEFEFYDSIFKLAYESGSVTIYIDELYSVTESARPSRWLRALYTRGREPGIGVWASTQRPAWVPLFSLSESEHYFVFRLTLEDDRKRMSSFMGPAVLDPIRDPHGLFYMRATDDRPAYYRSL